MVLRLGVVPPAPLPAAAGVGQTPASLQPAAGRSAEPRHLPQRLLPLWLAVGPLGHPDRGV